MGKILDLFTTGLSGLSTVAIKILLILGLIASVYFYWNHLENKITNLGVENTSLEQKNQQLLDANAANVKTITDLQDNIAKMQLALDNLNKSYAQIQLDSQKEKQIISQLLAKPVTKDNEKTINNQVNSEVNNLFNNIKDISNPLSFTNSKAKK